MAIRKNVSKFALTNKISNKQKNSIMNKNNYDDEATRFEETSFETQETTTAQQENNQPTGKQGKKGAWKQAAVGAASGLVIGSVSTVLMGMTTPEGNIGEDGKPVAAETENHREELSHPEWVDDEVQVATTVNDDMSFGEAFAAARTEVGPGGVFEWHGQLYGTYTADEWDNMTAEERAEYSDHFSWNRIDHSESDVAQHSTANVTNDDDIEVVSVNHEEPSVQAVETEVVQTEVVQAGYEEPGAGETEVEILGVVHDNENGMNFGGMTVGGEEVILVDVDGDMTFDYMAVDANGDNSFEENELVDIQSEQLTVNDLGGFVNEPTGDMLASNGPDYTTDAAYEA